MTELFADRASLTVTRREPVTSGARGAFRTRFAFSPDWDGLQRTAVFRAGDRTVSVLLDGSGECDIPWETLSVPGRRLLAGVYGVRDEDVALPTVWADCGYILDGASPGDPPQSPTPGAYELLLSRLKTAVCSDTLSDVVVLDRADYDALPGKDSATLYLIRG